VILVTFGPVLPSYVGQKFLTMDISQTSVGVRRNLTALWVWPFNIYSPKFGELGPRVP